MGGEGKETKSGGERHCNRRVGGMTRGEVEANNTRGEGRLNYRRGRNNYKAGEGKRKVQGRRRG